MKRKHFLIIFILVPFILLFSLDKTYGQQIRAVISPLATGQAGPVSQSEIMPSKLLEQSADETRQDVRTSVPEQRSASMHSLENTEIKSEFERFISGKVPSEISTDISQFGYSLFRNPPSTFAPVTNVPVSPGYIVGPGDEVRITVWGKVEGSWDVVVNRDGNISLPKVGVIGITGLTFTELKKLLHREFSKYYTGFEMNVSMGSLKTVRVYIVGNASRPGAYTISSLSTIVNALFEAGGPDKRGTMRDIQLKRNGKTIGHFDMYDFLLKGDRTGDMRLMPEDVIFVPPVGPLAGIAGSVKRPAIYEMRGESRLLDLIDMAGGLASTAFKGRVQVQRVRDHQFRTLFEDDLIDLKKNAKNNFIIGDGDLVKVFSVSEANNTVNITGAVVNSGEYAIIPGRTRLGDVISKAGGLLYYASNYAELTRVRVTESGPRTEMLHIDISKAVKGDPKHNIFLKINDYLFVRTVPEWKLYRTVTIDGEVKYPGTYTIRNGERLSSLIKRSGGYTDNAYLRGAVFTRGRIRDIQQQSMTEMIGRLERELALAGATEVSTALSAEEITAKKAAFGQQKEFLLSLKKLKAKGRMTIKLAHHRLLKGSEYDIELEEGDDLFIPRKSSVVNVLGAVVSPGSFVYTEKMKYQDYIEMAGGLTKYAEKENVYVLKVDGTARKLKKGFIGWSSSRARWEVAGFGDEIKGIEPGDTIIAPDKLDRIAWLREVKDVTQIIYQIAVAAGVTILLF